VYVLVDLLRNERHQQVLFGVSNRERLHREHGQ
jgi:hypothetical protein